MKNRYSYSAHSSGITIKNLVGDTIAVIDCEEKLTFISPNTSSLVKKEVLEFLDKNDVAYFL